MADEEFAIVGEHDSIGLELLDAGALSQDKSEDCHNLTSSPGDVSPQRERHRSPHRKRKRETSTGPKIPEPSAVAQRELDGRTTHTGTSPSGDNLKESNDSAGVGQGRHSRALGFLKTLTVCRLSHSHLFFWRKKNYGLSTLQLWLQH